MLVKVFWRLLQVYKSLLLPQFFSNAFAWTDSNWLIPFVCCLPCFHCSNFAIQNTCSYLLRFPVDDTGESRWIHWLFICVAAWKKNYNVRFCFIPCVTSFTQHGTQLAVWKLHFLWHGAIKCWKATSPYKMNIRKWMIDTTTTHNFHFLSVWACEWVSDVVCVCVCVCVFY